MDQKKEEINQKKGQLGHMVPLLIFWLTKWEFSPSKHRKMVEIKTRIPEENSKLSKEGLSSSSMNWEDDEMEGPLSTIQSLISSDQNPAEKCVGEQMQKEKDDENKPSSPEENSNRNKDGSKCSKINQETSAPNDGLKSVLGKNPANAKQQPTENFPLNHIDEALLSNTSKETEKGHELYLKGNEQKGNQINPEHKISQTELEKFST
jgi:hypothetical protein